MPDATPNYFNQALTDLANGNCAGPIACFKDEYAGCDDYYAGCDDYVVTREALLATYRDADYPRPKTLPRGVYLLHWGEDPDSFFIYRVGDYPGHRGLAAAPIYIAYSEMLKVIRNHNVLQDNMLTAVCLFAVYEDQRIPD